MLYPIFIWLILLWPAVNTADPIADLHANLLSGSATVRVVSPQDGSLTLVVDAQSYNLTFSPSSINGTALNLDSTQHRGTWYRGQIDWLSTAAALLREANPKNYKAAQLMGAWQMSGSGDRRYVMMGTTQATLVVQYVEKKKTQHHVLDKVNRPIAILVDGGQQHPGYTIWNDSLHRGVVEDATDGGVHFTLPLEMNHQVQPLYPIPIRVRSNEIIFYSTGYEDEVNTANNNSRKLTEPLFGFIFKGTIHLWEPARRQVLVFADPGVELLKSLEESGGNLSQHTLPLTVIPFGAYFTYTPSAPSQPGDSSLWIYLTVGVLLVSLVVLFYLCCIQRWSKKSAGAAKSKSKVAKKADGLKRSPSEDLACISTILSARTEKGSGHSSQKSSGSRTEQSSPSTPTSSSQTKSKHSGCTTGKRRFPKLNFRPQPVKKKRPKTKSQGKVAATRTPSSVPSRGPSFEETYQSAMSNGPGAGKAKSGGKGQMKTQPSPKKIYCPPSSAPKLSGVKSTKSKGQPGP